MLRRENTMRSALNMQEILMAKCRAGKRFISYYKSLLIKSQVFFEENFKNPI